MSIRNLDQLFNPVSVAVFGASLCPASMGAAVWRNVRSSHFKGPVYAVNPKYRELDGELVFARAADLPTVPELAVICTPPATVAGLIAELGALGTRAAVVLNAGLDSAQKAAMLAAARPHLLRILGPDCSGLLVPHIGLKASFVPADALRGELAFVSQSHALVAAMLDWARTRAIGFSHVVSLGSQADVDLGDMLDYLGSDSRTRAIMLYIEAIKSPRKFMSAARAAARNKPVIVVKSGRSPHGQQAAAAHTCARAGSDMVYDAAIARAGMLRVDTLQQLFLAAETLTRFRTNPCEELTILSNSGGAGVMAADAASHAGVKLADLGERTLRRLDGVLPGNWSRANPVDIGGDAPVERYVQALQALNDDPAASAVLLIHAPSAIVPSAEIAQALLPLAHSAPPHLIACWLGEAAVAQARQTFQDGGIACYPTPEEAVRAFAMLVTYRRNQAQLMEAPATAPPAPPASHCAASAAEAIGFPVALKMRSSDILHKCDVGGVALNLDNAAMVGDAVQAMLARVRQARPDALLDGFTEQAMVRHSYAYKLIVGASIDSVFGPVILFGQGGTSVEVLGDRAVALPPLNATLARALVQRTRVAGLLREGGDTPCVDQEAVYAVLVAVSQLLADVPEIAELDINPLILSLEGAIALNAHIRLSARGPAGAGNFAIRPYPAHLVETIEWQGRRLTLRPIRPEDEAQHLAFLESLDPADVRLRVFYSRRSIERSELARLTQIDYEREMAIVAVAPGGAQETLGVVRAIADPDNIEAEFGIIVRSDLKGMGLGKLLMLKLIRTLREHGTERLVATVLTENQRMLALAQGLGFVQFQPSLADGTRGISFMLQSTVTASE